MLRSKISMSVSAALLLGLVSITGCGTNTAEKSNVQTNSVRGVNDGRIGVNSVRGGTHNITKMEVSQELADRIAAMPEVRSANVMLAGKSAYVAVTLNDATAGMRAKGTPSYRAKSSTTPHNYGPTGVMSGTGRVKIGSDGMNDTGAVTNGMNGALKGTVNTVMVQQVLDRQPEMESMAWVIWERICWEQEQVQVLWEQVRQETILIIMVLC